MDTQYHIGQLAQAVGAYSTGSLPPSNGLLELTATLP